MRKTFESARRLGRNATSLRARTWIIIISGAFLAAILTLWILATFAGAVPGDIGYPVKRWKENVNIALTSDQNAKEKLKFEYASRRIGEALILTDRLNDRSLRDIEKENPKIQQLIEEYRQVAGNGALLYGQLLNQGVSIPEEESKSVRSSMAHTYVMLEKLRLGATPETQSFVLQAIAATHTALATAQDVLKAPPISTRDGKELTNLVSYGFLTSNELTRLISSATSNRELLRLLREYVKAGEIPSAILHAMNYDLVEDYDAQKAKWLRASVIFDEMRKVSLFAEIITPDAATQQAVDSYLTTYRPGAQIPRGALQPYASPIIYGLSLVSQLPESLEKIEADRLSPSRLAFYEAWRTVPSKAELKKNPKDLYNYVLELTSAGVAHDAELLKRIQLEVLRALRANVVHHALPPGWTAGNIVEIQERFSEIIRQEEQYKAMNGTMRQLITSLSTATEPILANTETADHLPTIRQPVEQALRQIVTIASDAKDTPATSSSYDGEIQKLQKQLNELTKNSRVGTEEKTKLQQAVEQTIRNLLDTNAQFDAHVAATNSWRDSVDSTIAEVQAQQQATMAALSDQIEMLASDSEARASLASALTNLQATTKQQVASLEAELDAVIATHQQTQRDSMLAGVTHTVQIGDLTARIATSQENQARLKSVIDDLSLAYNISVNELNDSVATLNSQVLQLAYEQKAVLQTVEARASASASDKTAIEMSLATLSASQTALASKIDAQNQSNLTLNQQVEASLSALGKSQTQTSTELANIKNDVESLQQAAAAITQNQGSTQLQIDNLLSSYNSLVASLPDNLAELQRKFEAAQKQLEASFTAKIASLEQQFSAYRQELDAAITQLKADSDARIQELEAEQEALRKRLDEAEAKQDFVPPGRAK